MFERYKNLKRTGLIIALSLYPVSAVSEESIQDTVGVENVNSDSTFSRQDYLREHRRLTETHNRNLCNLLNLINPNSKTPENLRRIEEAWILRESYNYALEELRKTYTDS